MEIIMVRLPVAISLCSLAMVVSGALYHNDENTAPKPPRSLLHAGDSIVQDNATFRAVYGFLVQPSYLDLNEHVCLGTMIHSDALVTTSSCQEHFAVGARVESVEGESAWVSRLVRLPQAIGSPYPVEDDLMLVFLNDDRIGSQALWVPDSVSCLDSALGTGTTFVAGPHLIIASVDVVNNEAFSPVVCSEGTARTDGATSDPTKGAPLLNEQNCLLGVMTNRQANSENGTIDGRLCYFARLESYTDVLKHALCRWSKFPPPHCTVYAGTGAQRSLVVKVNRLGLIARLVKWFNRLFDSPPSSPAPPVPTVPVPTVPTPTVPVPTVPMPTVPVPTVRTPTAPVPTVTAPNVSAPSAPVPTAPLPTTTAPLSPRAPLVPPKPPTRVPVRRPSAMPSMEPTAVTIPPTTFGPMPRLPPVEQPSPPSSPVPPTPSTTCRPSIECPGRNLMERKCVVQCVAESNVVRKRRAGWRCGKCVKKL